MEDKEPKAEPLVFPRAVRFPRKWEIPGDPHEVLSRIAEARITTGYILSAVEDQPYVSYIEANVHAPNIFKVFSELARSLMPDIAAPVICIKESEPVFGPYTDRESAISIFEPHIEFLENDGFIEFGIVHQSEETFEEVYVASPKYFKIWTNHSDIATEILRRNGIPKCETLEFIDEYPMVSLSLGANDTAAWTEPFEAIQDEFTRLPSPPIRKR